MKSAASVMTQQHLIIAAFSVDLCPNCETSKDHEQNYIQVHDTLPIFPSFRDVARPNHFLMRAWPFAVFARKSFLQAFRQKRRPQWLWWTRPNFPPQFVQRFSNLVMKLSTDLEVDGTTRQTRAIVVCLAGSRPLGRGWSKISLRPALTMWSLPSPRACLAPPILCYFRPTDCNPPEYPAWEPSPWPWISAFRGNERGAARSTVSHFD